MFLLIMYLMVSAAVSCIAFVSGASWLAAIIFAPLATLGGWLLFMAFLYWLAGQGPDEKCLPGTLAGLGFVLIGILALFVL